MHTWLAVLVAVYVAAVLLKQAFREQKDIRGAMLVAALFLVPSLLVVYFVYDGALLDVFRPDLPVNKNPKNWWVFEWKGREADGEGVKVNLLAAAVIVAALQIAATLLIAAASAIYARKTKVEPLAIHKAVVKLPIVLIGACIVLKIQLGAILLGTSVIVIGLGLVLKGMLENLFTGMALETEGTLRQGDWIQVGDSAKAGKVYERGWRVTKLRTLDDQTITVPNRTLAAEMILNYDRPQRYHARIVSIGASYDDPPVKVKEILRAILLREPEVLKEPAPQVRCMEYGDFAILYEMKYWIADYGRHKPIQDKVMTQVWYAFQFYGVTIPFPIRTVHLKERRQLDEERSHIDGEVAAKVGFLRELPFFAPLTSRELDFLAVNSFKRRFEPGEHAVHRGEIGDALYVVMSGWCEVLLPDGRRPRIASGQYFGEIGLLGARARTVDVVAGAEGAVVLRIDKYCMDVMFRTHPGLVDQFKEIRDARRRELPEEREVAVAAKAPLWSRVCRKMADISRPW